MRKYLRLLLWTAVIVGAIVGGLRLTVLDWFTMPSDDAPMALSAAPNLSAGDTFLLWRGGTDVGDLVRCTDPDEPRRFVYGRLLAKSFEVVEISGQELKVDGRGPVQETACTVQQVTVEQPSGDAVTLSCGMEAFRGYKYARLRAPSDPRTPSPRTITVPAGRVFVVSDNRAFPLDSREYGTLPSESCRNTFFFRLWGKKGIADAERRFTYVR